MLSNHKLISVVVPAYNCGKYILECIESILAQTYKNFEIIVIDDGSTDSTRDLLFPYLQQLKIKYFYQRNKGPSSARNLGIQKASGQYIAFLDADDIWEKDKLEKSINFMELHKFDWICTSMVKLTEKGERIIKRIDDSSWVINPKTKEIKQLKNGLFFFSSIPVHTPTIVVKKHCFDRVGIFDESFLIGEDTDLWLRFEEAGLRGGYLDEPLTIYSYNENSITKGKKVDGLEEHAKVAKKHAQILGIKKEFIRNSYSNFLWEVADRYYSDKKYFKTAKYIFKSLLYNPKNIKRIVRKLSVNKKREVKRISILYYEPSSGYGGSSRCLFSWLKKLDREKFEPIIAVHYDGPAIKKINTLHIKLIKIPFKSKYFYNNKSYILRFSYLLLLFDFFFFTIPTAIFLMTIIKKYKVNIIHLNAKVIGVIPGIIASKLMHIYSICHIHETSLPSRIEKIFGRWVDCLIVLTDKARNLYGKQYLYKKMELIHNAIDLNDYNFEVDKESLKKAFNIERNCKVVGIVGRLIRGKGFSDFIKAAKIILSEGLNVKFIIVGSAAQEQREYEEYLKRLTKELKIQKNIIFTGWREDVKEIMSIFEVLVQASSTFPEGFSLTCIEAMALSKPLVVTDIPGSSEIVIDGITGFIVPPANPDRLAEALRKLIIDDSLSREMGENGYKRVKERFNLDVIIKKIESLYLSLAY